MAFLIRDGATEEDLFPGQHWIPKFKFSYRPALPERMAEYREAIKGAGAKTTYTEQVKFLKEHLVSWEISDKEGGPNCSTKDDAVYERLPTPVVDFIWGCIASYGPDRWRAAEKNSPSAAV